VCETAAACFACKGFWFPYTVTIIIIIILLLLLLLVCKSIQVNVSNVRKFVFKVCT
jgi:hypothetical protein